MIICDYRKDRLISYWDKYARWYKLWIEHNNFHEPVIQLLFNMVCPESKVLDIGAGNGILSLPLASMHCQVTAMEPSDGMRILLYEEMMKRNIDNIIIDNRRFEDVSILEYSNYDLIIASNSLHLTEMGFQMALQKVFSLNAKSILLVSEINRKINIFWDTKKYNLSLCRIFFADTSFAYHNYDEAIEHFETLNKKKSQSTDKIKFLQRLTYRNGHYWNDEEGMFGIYFWHKI